MKTSKLAALFQPLLQARGLELEAVDVTPVGKRKLIRVTIDGDGPHGHGLLLDDIATASQAMSAALDEATFIGQCSYTLEVSSRGVSKPLTQVKHFRRNRGRLVKLWLKDYELVARIISSSDDDVTVSIDGTVQTISYLDIKKAVVQVELNSSTDNEQIEDEKN